MLETYKAILRGNHLRWKGEVPGLAHSDDSEVEVMVTILEKDSESKDRRPFGLAKGEFVVPDDFDAPLPEEILAGFEN